MNPSKKERDPLVQFKLSDWLHDVMGDSNYITINRERAEYIEAVSQGTLQCHIQWKQHNGLLLRQPVLWKYSAWVRDSDRWLTQKKKSDEERVAKFIFDRNVANLAYAIEDQYPFDKEWALSNAVSIVAKKQVGKAAMFGVTLIEKESEL